MNKQKVRPQVLGAGSNLQNICQLADFESAQLGEIALVSHILTSVKCFSEIWSKHTHTHKVGGPDLLFLGLGAICGARRGRIQWPEWLLPAIVFVLCCILPAGCNRICIALYCMVAPGRNRPICQK